MPRHEYERRLVERLDATRRWENEPVPEGVSIKDLDKQEIQLTLDNAIRLGRLEATDRRDLATILCGLYIATYFLQHRFLRVSLGCWNSQIYC